jgi:hypothetical protein
MTSRSAGPTAGFRVTPITPGQLHISIIGVRPAGQRTSGDIGRRLAQRQSHVEIAPMGYGFDAAMTVQRARLSAASQ